MKNHTMKRRMHGEIYFSRSEMCCGQRERGLSRSDAPVFRRAWKTTALIVLTAVLALTAVGCGSTEEQPPDASETKKPVISAPRETAAQEDDDEDVVRFTLGTGKYSTHDRSIDAEGCKLTDKDLAAIPPESEVAELNLRNNAIRSITTLSGFSGLTKLDLSDNQLRDIRGVEVLVNLEELSLDGNEITGLSGLTGLTSLRTLSLADNRIQDVGVLAQLQQLKTLNLSGNSIADVSALEALTELASLDLRGTEVSREQVTELRDKLPDCEITSDYTLATKLKFVPFTEELVAGKSYPLKIAALPSKIIEALNNQWLMPKFTVSDETIATVSEDGTLNCLKAGTVTVSMEMDGLSDSMELEITAPVYAGGAVAATPEPVVQLSISPGYLALVPGLISSISVNSTCEWVSFASSNPVVATVDGAGNVTGRHAGDATIVVSSNLGTAYCSVHVSG